MTNKKIQANMQINVSFLGDTTKLLKQLESDVQKLNLSSTLGAKFGAGLDKNFKNAYTNLEKTVKGLSEKGLSSKQYTEFFNTMQDKLKSSIQFTKTLKSDLQTMFESSENKQALKELENFKKKLEEINKLVAKQKGADTRQQTSIKKLKEETGLDYNISKKMLDSIAKRKANKQDRTKTQDDWVKANGLDEETLKRALELMKQIEAQSKKILDINKQAKQITGNPNATAETAQKGLVSKIGSLENYVITPEFIKNNNDLLDQLSESGKLLENQVDELLPRFQGNLTASQQEAEKLAKAGMTLNEIFAQFGIVFSAAAVVRGFQELTKEAFNFYKSLDSALNEIYVVSNLTIDSVNNLKANFITMAKETGMAIDDVTRAAVLFYQQGLNTDEVLTMTEVTSQFAKVAGVDATDAADKLTAAVNGYCMSAENAIDVADKFNKVAAASAADINELSTAFSKAAAQANQAGVSMDNYLAYIATMEEATREAPENIGTSLKTIFSRMQQVKESGTTEDGDTDVNKVETALESVGIALRDTKGELRDLEDVFDELGPKWQSLDRNTQAYLGTIIAGTRQQSRFITLMQNWDRVLDLADQSANSAGMQALMHEKAMDSITSKVEQFQVAWQEFVSNLTSSNVIKGLVSGLTKLVNVFNSGNKPISLMVTSIGLLAIKLKDLQSPITNKVKDFKENFEKFRNQDLPKHKEQKEKIKRNKENIDAQQKIYDTEVSNFNTLVQELSTKGALTEEDEKQILNAEEKLQLEKQKLDMLKEEGAILKNQTTDKEMVGKSMVALGTAVSGIGIAVSQSDDNLGGLVSGAGSIMTTIGQFTTGNWIGGLMTAATSIYQITQTIGNWEENVEARIKESVAAVSDALESYNNDNTQIKTVDNLLDKYDKLSKKLYRTEAEQKSLNETIQQLGDIYGVDVIADAYGNLSININEVTQQLDAQKAKQEEALQKLDEIERKSISKGLSGLGNDTTVTEYMEELFSSTKSQYKVLLTGVEDGLTDEARNISKTIADSFASNLKNAIIKEVEQNGDEYMVEGLGNSVVNLEKKINETLGGDENAWNDLYSHINFLEQNINDMTYEQAQAYLNNYFSKWHEELNLTQEQWDILKNSINNTVFKNTSLLEFFGGVDELNTKIDGSFWENEEKTGKIDKLHAQMVEQVKKLSVREHAADLTVPIDGDNTDWDAVAKWYEDLDKSDFNNPFNNIWINKETEKTWQNIDNLNKAYQEAYKEREKFYQKYSDEHNLDGIEDAQAYTEALDTLAESLKNTSQETITYMGSIENLYDTEGMKGNEAAQYAETIKQAMSLVNAMGNDATNADRFDVLSRYYEKNKSKMKDNVKEQWEEVLEEAFNELQVSTPRTLTSIGEELKDIGSDLIQMNEIMGEFNEAGSLSLDTFIDLAKIIDGINLDDLGKLDPSAIDAYIQAIGNLNLAYDENNGHISMNADSLATLQDIQELQTKSKIAGMIADLKASKATTETQIAYIDAQIAATDAAIEAASVESGTKVTANEIMGAADVEYAQKFGELMTGPEGIVTQYQNDVVNQGTWSTAILNNLGTVAEAWSRYYTGIRDGSTQKLSSIKDMASKILSEEKHVWEGAGEFSGIDWENKYKEFTAGSDKQKELVAELQAYRAKLENSKKSYTATLDLTNKEISLLENMYNSDLSKLGSKDDKAEELQQYLGKLKEIYNIENRIALLEHRLGTLDTYSDIAEGKEYGEYLKQRIGLTDELLGQYEFLVNEQKAFTNGYRDFIKSSAVGDVFDFDEFGQIIINFEKYNALQDKAVSGEKSLKEQADELYDAYTEMFDELQGDFDAYISYLKKAIDLQQEMVDAYVEIETKAADAVKEIYQKILDTKLDAIDQEKEAIEDLRKAREDARKDQENAKEISGLQTNLQRAMMDTSGASDTNLIKAQQDLDDKLNQMAEDKYSEMLDNIITQLDEEQEALRDNFDMLFDNLDWLHEMIEQEMMTNEDRLLELFTQTDEWSQLTTAERKQQTDEWKTSMNKYMDTIQNGSTILDVCNYIDALQRKTVELDTALKNQVSNTGIQIANALKDGIDSSYNSGVAAGAASNKGNSYYSKSPFDSDEPIEDVEVGGKVPDIKEYSNTITSITSGPYTKWIGETVEPSGSGDVSSYNDDGTPANKISNPLGYNPNVEITEIGVDREKSYFAKVSYDKNFKTDGKWIPIEALQTTDFFGKKLSRYRHGGFANFTGPAWLDGTKTKPEAVLNALQTEHFISFTNALDKLTSGKYNNTSTNSSVNIDTISFNVESMSSAEDGEKAFNMFVDKFKEIGNRTGIKVDSFKNTL